MALPPDFLTPLNPPYLPLLILPLHNVPQKYINLFLAQEFTQLREITPTWSDQRNLFAKRYTRGEVRWKWYIDERYTKQLIQTANNKKEIARTKDSKKKGGETVK
jgi:hypothetical protein